MTLRSRIAAVGASTVMVLALTGCGEVQQAIDSANQAVDGAQSLLDAPARIGAACEDALGALAEGRSPEAARTALDSAVATLDAELGVAGSLPGLSQLRDAFVAAAESLAGSADQTAAARSAIEAACSPFAS